MYAHIYKIEGKFVLPSIRKFDHHVVAGPEEARFLPLEGLGITLFYFA